MDRVFQYHRKHNHWRELITRDPGPEEAELVYSDRALITRVSPAGPEKGAGVPISSSSQPSLMAQMLEDLQLRPGLHVLEIGGGTGYNAALLAHLVGETGRIVTVDIDEDLVQAARAHLVSAGYGQVNVILTDGALGSGDEGVYDRIILTVASTDIAPAWRDQLASPGGRLVLPLGLRGVQRSLAFEAVNGARESQVNATIALATSITLRFAVNNTGLARETVVMSLRLNNLDRVGFAIRFTSYRIGGVNHSARSADPLPT